MRASVKFSICTSLTLFAYNDGNLELTVSGTTQTEVNEFEFCQQLRRILRNLSGFSACNQPALLLTIREAKIIVACKTIKCNFELNLLINAPLCAEYCASLMCSQLKLNLLSIISSLFVFNSPDISCNNWRRKHYGFVALSWPLCCCCFSKSVY